MAAAADDIKDLLIRVDAQTELMRQGLSRAASDLASFQKSANDNLKKVDADFKALGSTAQFNRGQLLELTHVGKSLFDQMAAGSSPLKALTVEGGRLAQIVAGSGGITGAMSGLISLVGGPYVAGFAVATAVTAGLVAIYSHGQSEVAKFQNTLTVTGNAAGLTRDRFDGLSAAIAAAATTSNSNAAEVANGLVKNGELSRAEIQELGVAAIRLGALTGESTDKIIKSFEEAQKAPSEYATKFATAYDLLTPAQVAHIRLLEQQGQKAEAFRIFSEALSESLGNKQAAQLGIFARALKFVADRYDEVADAAKRIGTPSSTTDKLKDAQTILGQLQGQTVPSFLPQSQKEAIAARLTAQRQLVASLQDQVAAENTAADAQATHRKEELAGVAASADLADHFEAVGDNARKASAEIKRFKDDLAAALKSNPTDAVALDRQAHAEQIIADIRRKYSKDSARDDKERDAAAKRYLAQFESLAHFVKEFSDHLPDIGKTFDLDFSRDGAKLKPIVDLLDQMQQVRPLSEIVSGIDNSKANAFDISHRDRPGQTYRQTINDANAVSDAVDQIKVDGLTKLNDSLADAVLHFHSLGSVAHDVADQIIGDLLRIAIQQAVIKPLANALFPNSAGGTASSGIASFLSGLGKREGGGPVSAGTPYIVGEKRPELFVPRVPGVIVPRLPGGGGQGGTVEHVVTVTPSPLFSVVVEQRASNAGAAAAAGVIRGATTPRISRL